MQALRRCCFLIVLLLTSSLFAQDAPKADDGAKKEQRKRTAIIEQALGDIQNLRLPENRAFFDCQVGGLLWSEDKAHARELFQNAAAELISAQNAAEQKRSLNPNNELLNSSSTRPNILNTIANRDAQLALDLMVKTRPSAVQRAMMGEAQPSTKIGNFSRANNYVAMSETAMEQNFYRLAAEQSPDHAVKLLKEAIAKGLTNDTFSQLIRLAEKDPSVAAELASQVVTKLIRSDYMADGQPLYINIQLTNTILSTYVSQLSNSPHKLRFDDSQIRELTAKYISAYISEPLTAPYIGQSIVGLAEKLSPASVDPIKKATARMFPQSSPYNQNSAYQALMNADTPPEQVMAAAGKFGVDVRRQLYENASNKFMGRGNIQAARAILDENFSDNAHETMLNNFDQQLAYHLIGENKFTEAEQVIDGLPEPQRIPMLVNLANSLFARDPKENKTYASELLTKAIRSTSERPENSAEMGMLTQIVSCYGNIDPAESLRILEGLVPKINELTDAAAVINGFQAGSNVREGEFVMSQGDPFSGYGIDPVVIAPLAKFDFDRIMHLIDSFTRSEIRLSLRLKLVESNGSNSRVITSLPIQSRSIRSFSLSID